MHMNHYPNYYTNSFYKGIRGLRTVNGRESVITVSSPFPYNQNYNYNYNYSHAQNYNQSYNQNYNQNYTQPIHQIRASPYVADQIDRQSTTVKSPSPTPIKLDPKKLLLKPQLSKLPPKPKSRSRTIKTSTTSLIHPKHINLLKQKSVIDKSTSTTSLNANKIKVLNVDKSTQTYINKIKLIALNKEQRPPIPPSIIGSSAKREEKKQKLLTKISSASSSPMSRPMSILSEKSLFSTVSTASTSVTKLKFLGVTRCDPNEYKSKYQSSLISSKNIPEMLSQIINNVNFINANNSSRLSNRLKSPLFKPANLNEKFG